MESGTIDRITIAEIRDRTTLTVPEAGRVFGMSRGSAYQAAQRGELPTIRIGRRIVVPVPALLRLLGADLESA